MGLVVIGFFLGLRLLIGPDSQSGSGGFDGGGNPLLLFVEGGGFVRTDEAEEPFLLRLF